MILSQYFKKDQGNYQLFVYDFSRNNDGYNDENPENPELLPFYPTKTYISYEIVNDQLGCIYFSRNKTKLFWNFSTNFFFFSNRFLKVKIKMSEKRNYIEYKKNRIETNCVSDIIQKQESKIILFLPKINPELDVYVLKCFTNAQDIYDLDSSCYCGGFPLVHEKISVKTQKLVEYYSKRDEFKMNYNDIQINTETLFLTLTRNGNLQILIYQNPEKNYDKDGILIEKDKILVSEISKKNIESLSNFLTLEKDSNQTILKYDFSQFDSRVIGNIILTLPIPEYVNTLCFEEKE